MTGSEQRWETWSERSVKTIRGWYESIYCSDLWGFQCIVSVSDHGRRYYKSMTWLIHSLMLLEAPEKLQLSSLDFNFKITFVKLCAFGFSTDFPKNVLYHDVLYMCWYTTSSNVSLCQILISFFFSFSFSFFFSSHTPLLRLLLAILSFFFFFFQWNKLCLIYSALFISIISLINVLWFPGMSRRN